jgi:ABC-type transport system involved in multi-copper enzyme maturation permease subunit
MLSLLQADLFKVRRGALIWWSLGIALGFFAAQLLYSALVQSAHTNLSFIDSLLNMNQLLGQFIPFFTMLLGASIIGNEYVHDMWKNLLTRQSGRERFIVSKTLAFLIIFVLGLLIFALFNIILGLVLQTAFHPRGPHTTLPLGNVLLSILITSLNPIMQGLVAMMGAILGRSMIAGVLFSLPWSIFDSVMSGLPLPAWIQQGFFTAADKGLFAHSLNRVTPLGIWPSLIVVVLYLVVPLAIAVYVFRRRDMAA